ncbi:2,3-diphosphoglycerate-dependent phosphoglycerate mutase [uncultured Oxalicibacterium sp.]|uniref:2,3-diphosphoglycerate-dependent phosphoglycerate mutase n=1 Tax=uncultured Oxalicibacterium sp. TaxID=1168540 RepID=UPI0025D3F5CD|nr:2,3-diphosphoglycerate-dependent phosphoglycerate mutase [uncultured Oxalicibacterium sp.]
MGNLVIVRHGESQWNLQNRFTGWTDIDLTEKGQKQARRAGRALVEAGIRFDLAFTSVLKRVIRSQWLIVDEMDLMYIPVISHWRLNERHYGALTGQSRADVIAQFGEEQVWQWRRGYASRPPLMASDDPRAPANEDRYRHLPSDLLPLGESLEDTVARVRVFWEDSIKPALQQDKDVLICTHGNSQRALVRLLEPDLSDEEVARFDVPNGVPLVYRLDAALRVLDRHSLAIDEATSSSIL